MVADNEGVEVEGGGESHCSQARDWQKRLCTELRTRETLRTQVWEVE